VGFDFVDPGTRQFRSKAWCVAFFRRCLEAGLIAMSYTPRVRIHPPLILNEGEARRALTIIEDALAGC
jgi:4-aminobutyrate aminotransferase-like enzyme